MQREEIIGMRGREMQKGGQRTQVNLLHRQNPAADIYPVGYTLVSAHISVNALAFMNITDKACSVYQPSAEK